MDGCQHMVGYHATSTHPAAPPIHPFRETVEGWVSFHPTRPGGQTHGRMPLCGRITPTYSHPAASPTPQGSIAICRVSSPRTHGGPRAAFSGHGNSPPTPTHHARPLVSALPPRCTIHRILHRKSWPRAPSEPTHVPRCAACHSCTSTVVYVSQRVEQVVEGVEWRLCSEWAARRWWWSAIHAKRGIHTTHLSYRLYSLCSSVPRRVAFEPLWMDTSALRHTERSLQLDGSHHDRITQLVIHQQQPEL